MSRNRSIRGRRAVLVAALAAGVCAGMSSAARSAPTATLCVDTNPGCFSTVQAAVNAAHDGDTIQIAPGTFQGGITIDKSVKLVGRAAAVTILRGGGPVITIGRFGGDNHLDVVLSRLTITGGLNDSQPSTSVVAGGGVSIPGSAGNAAGAAVAISESVITRNRVTARTTIPPGGFSCPLAAGHPCAFVNGGGIDNSGVLTLTDTRVSDNVAGAAPGGTSIDSNASGGGIDNHQQGTLAVRRSFVTGNRVTVAPPNGAFSDGGGIASGGVLSMVDSVVSGNSSDADAAVPSSFFSGDTQQEANAGGIYLREGSSATIVGSTISDNSVSGSNSIGDAQAQAGGIDDDGSLLLNDSTVSRNVVHATAPSGTLALGIEGGIQVGGSLIAHASRIVENVAVATSVGGFAAATGGGLDNLGQTTLAGTVVSGNRVAADGAFGVAHGGGISNFTLDPTNPPRLKLLNSSITDNGVRASVGITPEGGGLWTDAPVVLVRTVITGNNPDQCVGC